ncbi:MAG TPA: hypothetical protein VNO50_10830 [Pyrinomonadaceae bacterium]|nr:hypothetical protein [Pyrinomonadaceae bacterium]
MKTKPPCETVLPWLKANLGKHCLAPLTSTDAKALAAAVQIIELYAYHPGINVIDAFGEIVGCMQQSTQELAYHSIAMVMNWEDREPLWVAAGLPAINPRKCAFEPATSVLA